MEAVKRIEIVVSEVIANDVVDLLDRHCVSGYTTARGLGGKGSRGVQASEGLTGDANVGFLIACPAPTLGPLVEDLRALLKRYGGMCLVSDALWLRH